MPFGPLVTLMLLVYLLFLGVVLTLWFALSPGRKPDMQEDARQDEAARNTQRERPTRAEERSARRSARVYAGSNDEVRGANARAEVNRARETSEEVETNRRTRGVGARTRTRETRTRDSGTRDEGTRDTKADEGAKRTPASSPAATKKRSSDAFEDFIRSKNDDFEF